MPAPDVEGESADESAVLDDLPPTDEHPILLFDGVCNLCHGLVQFVVPRDSDATFRFASLQSPVGRALLAARDRPTDDLESLVLIEDGDAYTKSEGALRAARFMDRPYPLFRYLLAVPRPIRDRIYDVVAAYRYRIFGRKDACRRPDVDVDDVADRFLDE